MVMALILVFVVIGLLGLPVYFVLRAGVDGVPLQSVEWAGSVAAILAAIGVCWAATVVPLRMGAKRLWAKGVSND
jgi:hypothetical protein